MDKRTPIFIVDDDKMLNQLIHNYLVEEGFTHVNSVLTGEELFEKVQAEDSAIIIQDYDLPGMDGISVIQKAKREFPNLEFIFLSGQHSVNVAVEAIRAGAFDYIVKGMFATEDVLQKIKRLQQMKSLEVQKYKSHILKLVAILLFVLSCMIALLFM